MVSTIPRQLWAGGPPFLSRKELRFACSTKGKLLHSSLLLKEDIPLHSCNPIGLHSPEPKACRPMSLGSYRPENGYAILADRKRSLQLFGLLYGK